MCRSKTVQYNCSQIEKISLAVLPRVMTGLNKDNLGQINSSNDTNIEQIYLLKNNLQVLLSFIESVQTGEHPPSAGAE